MTPVDVIPEGDSGTVAGTLYLVPVPIGNPRDITLRAIDVLGQVGIVASEDTRHARTLLAPLGIETRLLSYHDHNEEARSPQLIAALREGTDIALVSDGGTPLVNDPGYRLVTAAIAAGIRVCPLPGTSATITALIGSGLPMHRFHYVGFLPRKAAARRSALGEVKAIDAALVFFEAPHRLAATVLDMHEVLGDRPAALARNLTKADEAFSRGTLAGLAAGLAAQQDIRGQYTIIVGGAGEEIRDEMQLLADRLADALLRHGADSRLAREVVREVTGLSRNWVYERIALAGKNGQQPGIGGLTP
ncbi:MAG TPA: 16S rRNA (cytidine(1402)-2'-O)-methyltransferase [Streptosporangiaceae bacterium]